MIKINENKNITVSTALLDTLGYNTEEKELVSDSSIFRTIDSNGACTINVSIGEDSSWNLRLTGQLPEDALIEMMSSLFKAVLKSMRGTYGEEETTTTE